MNLGLMGMLSVVLLIVGCRSEHASQDNTSVQVVIEDKRAPQKALVGVTLTPAKGQDPKDAMAKIENGTIMTSCGYEIELSKPNEIQIPPLNKYAFDSQWGAIGGNIQYYAGAVVAMTGFATGVIIIGGSSAGGLLAPPLWYGIYPGIALVASSALAGGTLGASGENKLKSNYESIYAFRELLSRKRFPANSTEYEARVATVRNAGNTTKICPPLKVGELKGIAGLK